MRLIKNIHNSHKDIPIWIAGSGPSLNTYPDNFFDNKIGITLHMAYVKFPGTTYMYANEPDRVDYLKKKYKSYYNSYHLYGYPFYGISKRESRYLVKDLSNVYYFHLRPYPPYGIRGKVDWDFTHKKVVRALDGKGNVFGGHGTCLHGALYSAIMLGGNPINLIGAGHGMYQGEEHFAGISEIDKEMRPSAPSFSDPNNNVPMIEQTLAIIEACRQRGVRINWIKEYRKSDKYENYEFTKESIDILKKNYTRKFSSKEKFKNAIKKMYNPMINSI